MQKTVGQMMSNSTQEVECQTDDSLMDSYIKLKEDEKKQNNQNEENQVE